MRLAPYIEDEWERFDEMLAQRNMSYAHECHWWLRGLEETHDYKPDFSDLHFQPKPSRNIRAEKTRDYRKHRRPKPARRYVPEMSIAAGLMLTFLMKGHSR